MQFVFVYITCPSETVAKAIAQQLLEARLIACANIHQIQSVYVWEDKVVDEPETVLLVKTQADFIERIEKLVADIHPYDTPCITQIPVLPNEKYAHWLTSCLPTSPAPKA